MSSGKILFNSLILFVLFLFLIFPAHTKNLKIEVIIELVNNKSYSGRLFDVDQYEIIIYGNNKIEKAEIKKIEKIGIKRRSRFLTGMAGGFTLGAAIGGVGAILFKSDYHGLLYSNKLGHILTSVIGSGIFGALFGGFTSQSISKYKYYNFSDYSDKKKLKFLKKLKRKANL